jgi:hypothetical protein
VAVDFRPPRAAFAVFEVDCVVTKQGGPPFSARVSVLPPSAPGPYIDVDAQVANRPRFAFWAADEPWLTNGELEPGDRFTIESGIAEDGTYSVEDKDRSDREAPIVICVGR